MISDSTKVFFAQKQLLVFGAGYVGGAVARAFLEAGGRVSAITRNPEKAAWLERSGVSPIVADIVGGDWAAQVPAAPDFVLNCVSSGGGGVENYRRSYLEGTREIIDWGQSTGQRGHLIYTGSTSVYPQGGGVWVDESMPANATEERSVILRETETLVGQWSGSWSVLRLAGIYGPVRHHLLNGLRAGNESVPGQAETQLNLVHRDDIVSAILLAFANPMKSNGRIFNVADDGRATKSEVVNWLADQLKCPRPVFSGKSALGRRLHMPNRVISNRLIKAELGWTPKFSTFREGYRSILEA